MKALCSRLVHSLFSSALDFRVRLFNLLAVSGALISTLMVFTSFIVIKSPPMALLNLALAALSLGLLYYSYISGRYQHCYLITIACIFFGGFGFLFFTGGGYRSGLPSFFVFSVVFTAFMLKGRLMGVTIALELLFYTALCFYAYYFPQRIVWLSTERALMLDTIVGFACVGLALGVTMFFIFRLYDRQQLLLEQARQEAVEANRAKSVFLANMSHEVRTPINIMLGMNEMILREQPSEQVATYAARAQDAGQMLLGLINDILDVSKIEAGKLELTQALYDTQSLIHELRQLGQELAEEKALSFSLELGSLPPTLWGDGLHLRQIAANLLSNAAKYTEAGWFKLRITTEPWKGGVLLSMSVSDSGIGISREQLNTLFAPFTRGEAALHRQIEGTGLGLAISKELVGLMDGTLNVESEPGKGSTFTVHIPQRLPDPGSEEVAPVEERTVESFLAPQGRVLLVDDNMGNLELLKAILSRTLLQVDTAQDGPQCLARVAENPYHVILLDYMMPGMNGAQTLLALRELGCTAPAIALTADASPATAQQLLDAGFVQCLTKPLHWARLEQALRDCLPPELVTHTKVGAPPLLKQEARALSEQLRPYGISLGQGLRFLSGDLAQYHTMARLFLENSQETEETLCALAKEGDCGALSHLLHALKSLSSGLGAGELATLCRQLESRCQEKDAAYLRAALPLLLHQLNLVRQGLSQLSTEASLSGDALQSDPARILAEARSHLEHYHGAESLSAMDRLISLEEGAEGIRYLEQARSAVELLNFEEAELLLEQYQDLKKEECAHVFC